MLVLPELKPVGYADKTKTYNNCENKVCEG